MPWDSVVQGREIGAREGKGGFMNFWIKVYVKGTDSIELRCTLDSILLSASALEATILGSLLWLMSNPHLGNSIRELKYAMCGGLQPYLSTLQLSNDYLVLC